METKSRYEVISELEEKKRNLIRERDSFEDFIKAKEKLIKSMKRQVEDTEAELEEFKNSVDNKKATITELIASIDDSLKRLSNLNSLSQKK